MQYCFRSSPAHGRHHAYSHVVTCQAQVLFFVKGGFDEEPVGKKRLPLASSWARIGELAYDVASGGTGQPGVPDGVIRRKDIRIISS